MITGTCQRCGDRVDDTELRAVTSVEGDDGNLPLVAMDMPVAMAANYEGLTVSCELWCVPCCQELGE